MKLASRLVAKAIASVLVLGGMQASAWAQRAALTQDIDQPGRNVFVLRQDTTTAGFVTFNLPAGKRYVIEQYNGDCAVPNAVSLLDIQIVAQFAGVSAFFAVQPHRSQNVGFGLSRYSGTGSGPIYADGGTTLSLVASVSSALSTDFRGCAFVVSGHTISNP